MPNVRFEMRPDEGPWRRVQPKCNTLVKVAPRQYAIAGELPNGMPVTIPLGRVVFRMR
jgi:hypothetical protein